MKRMLLNTFDLTFVAIVFVLLLVASTVMRTRRWARRFVRREDLRLA